jgi:hypothetical protein
VKRKPTSPCVEIWRVSKKPGTNDPECLHQRICKHNAFKEPANWQAAIRQSVSHWTVKRQCVILFRIYYNLGPGFDGQIDFLTGTNLITFKQREFRDGAQYQRKTEFEFKKAAENQFNGEKDPEKRKSMAMKRRRQQKLAFIVFVDGFVTQRIERKEQFESTRPISSDWLDKMEILFGSPHIIDGLGLWSMECCCRVAWCRAVLVGTGNCTVVVVIKFSHDYNSFSHD